MANRGKLSPEEAYERLIKWSPALQEYGSSHEDIQSVFDRAEGLARGMEVPPPKLQGEDIQKALRGARREFLLVSAICEVMVGSPIHSFPYLTACAEAFIEAAFEAALRDVCSRRGLDGVSFLAQCPIAIIGLGKLGARELNPSSDVDLLVVYGQEGTLGPHDFHQIVVEISRRMGSLLSEVTKDGFCLRVDYDLRPEGKTGALANSLEALLAYYEGFGSPLDRMALTRARPVAGDKAFGTSVIQALEPFVYPRTLSSGALPKIAKALSRLRSRSNMRGCFNVKTGKGGIRDVELFVAALQLLYGGRNGRLRQTRTLELLDAIFEAGLISSFERDTLKEGYLFLRSIEHMLQYRDDLQVHLLPLDGETPSVLASLILREEEGESFLKALYHHTSLVASLVDRLLGEIPQAGGEPISLLLDDSASQALREAAARAAGFREPDAFFVHLSRLRHLPTSPLKEGLINVEELEARLVKAASDTFWPDGAMAFLSRLFTSRRHKALFDLLLTKEDLLRRMVNLAAQSPIVAEGLLMEPEVALEEALRGFRAKPEDEEEIRHEALSAPIEEGGEALSRFLVRLKRRHILQIALFDLAKGEEAVGEVGSSLSTLAEACLQIALRGVRVTPETPLVVLGLGRLGSREMGYCSDLDLLFVYEGQKPPEIRKIQRALALLTTPSVRGPLYSLDLRLRPTGNQGPLLVDVERLLSYYLREAGGAEVLGALKVRPVAGDLRLGERVASEVRQIAKMRLRSRETLQEVLQVRKLQHQRVAGGSGAGYDPKLEAGGMLAIDTAAHFVWALQEDVPLCRPLDLLEALSIHPSKYGPDLALLSPIYRFFLHLTNRSYLVLERKFSDLDVNSPACDRLALSLGFQGLEESSPSREMFERIRASLTRSARICSRIFLGLLNDLTG